MSDANPVNQELETFNKQKLKKTNTQEKNHLPTQAGRSKEGTHKKNNLPAPFYPFFFFLLLFYFSPTPGCHYKTIQILHHKWSPTPNMEFTPHTNQNQDKKI